MHISYVIRNEDYAIFKQSCPDLPPSYAEWEDQKIKEENQLKAIGLKFQKVQVFPEGFLVYCKLCGFEPNLVTLGAFAVHENRRKI